jgi:hypothetical protein
VLLPSGAMVLPFSLSPALSGAAAAPTGLLLTATGGSYTLSGVPASAVYSAGSPGGAPAPSALLHTLTIPVDTSSAASPSTAALAPGLLLPGYFYRATVALTLTAALYTQPLPAGLAWANSLALPLPPPPPWPHPARAPSLPQRLPL